MDKGLHILPPDTTLENTITHNTTQSLNTAHQQSNSTFREFFPSLPIPRHVVPDYFTTQFFTGHGHYKAYLHRFGHSRSPFCICTNTPQTSSHLLLHCPHYTQIRQQLDLHDITTLQGFTKDKDTYTAFRTLCQHIHTHIKWDANRGMF